MACTACRTRLGLRCFCYAAQPPEHRGAPWGGREDGTLCGKGATRNECDPAQRDGRGWAGDGCRVMRAAPECETDVPAERGHTCRGVKHGEGLAVRFVVASRLTDGEARPQATQERAL